MTLLVLSILAWVAYRLLSRRRPADTLPRCLRCGANDWWSRSSVYRHHPAGPDYLRVSCGRCGHAARMQRWANAGVWTIA